MPKLIARVSFVLALVLGTQGGHAAAQNTFADAARIRRLIVEMYGE